MAVRDLIPWNKRTKENLTHQPRQNEPNLNVTDFMTGNLDGFWRSPFEWAGLSKFNEFHYPQIDLSETEKEFTVVSDLPGISEKDIDVVIQSNTLTIRGTKETVKEEKNRRYHKTEREWGSFCREIPLNQEIDESKVEASIKNGVLTIHLPKLISQGSDHKRITIKKI
jgi:HSP20 family protein